MNVEIIRTLSKGLDGTQAALADALRLEDWNAAIKLAIDLKTYSELIKREALALQGQALEKQEAPRFDPAQPF